MHTLAIVTGGAGLVGLGLGTAFAISASSTQHDADALCTSAGCTAEGKTLLTDAGRSADIASVGFIAGAALLAAGTVLWVASPSLRPAPRSVASPPLTAARFEF